MIAVRAYSPGEVREVAPSAISDEIVKPDSLVWVDVTAPSAEDLACLRDEFEVHPLALEDVSERHQRPKLEHYPSHAFVVAYSADLQEIGFFVSATWLISVRHEGPDGKLWPVEAARQRFERRRGHGVSSGELLHTLLDELVDGYFAATERSEDALETLEECVFTEQSTDQRAVQQQLFSARRELLRFRRAVVPLRDVLASLLRGDVDWIDRATIVHLQDVHDHVLRAVDQLDLQRELLANVVDAHLAIISNRMNEVMKKTTSWGAIILGSTLVAGIYGMNFSDLPALHDRFGYLWALGLMAAVTAGGYLFFRTKEWL